MSEADTTKGDTMIDPNRQPLLEAVATAAQLYVNRGPRSQGAWERLFDAVKALDAFEESPIPFTSEVSP